MADLLYSWAHLERDILNGDVGYFHGKIMQFNALKHDRNPEFIWLVRLRDGQLWLLGKLKVTGTKPSNFPKDHAPQFIFYSPSESFFFRDVEAIQEATQDTLADACRAMRNATMQGARSVDVLDPINRRKLERLTSNSALIPFNDFKQELLAGRVPCPPYGQGAKKGVKQSRYDDSLAKADSPSTDENTEELASDDSLATKELLPMVEGLSAQQLDDNEQIGTGYESDPKIRKDVEQHAVKRACSFYEKRGYSVIEKGKPYDLLCEKPGEVIHVEVKGSRSTLDAILVTTNEIKDARNIGWRSDLFLVDNIVLESTDSGRCRLKSNWVPEDNDLTPMQYRYKFPPILDME